MKELLDIFDMRGFFINERGLLNEWR